MLRRVALFIPVLWVSIAACSGPDAPAPGPAKAASQTPPAAPPASPPSPPPVVTPAPAPEVAAPPAPAEPPPLPPPPDGPRPVTRGWKSFEDGEMWGFKDAKGKVVLAPRYDVVQEFTKGGIACVVDGKDGWVCIDGNGAPLVRPFIVDNGPDEFSGGLARFVEAGKVGFFDDAGNKKIPARFSFAQPFSGDRAAFCDGCTKQCDGEHCSMVGGKWGLIDTTGKEVVAATFDEIGSFVGGTARAVKDGQELTIGRSGAPVPEKPKKSKKGG